MLADTALRNLKPKGKPYKVADRDGMYVTVSTVDTIVFRYDYRPNGRRETLALTRERLLDARKTVEAGHSPAQEKQRGKAAPVQSQDLCRIHDRLE